MTLKAQGGNAAMKKLIALCALLLATSAHASITGGGHGAPTYGLSSSIQADYPWCATWAPTIDDGFRWVYTDLIDSLRVVNADSGLSNTPWEMHATVGINLALLNGMRGFHGQDGTNGCPGGATDTCRMSAAEVQACNSSGLIEIASHGYFHAAIYMYSAENFTSTFENSRIWSQTPFGGACDSSMQQEIAGSYHCLVDSSHIFPVYTFLTPQHNMSNYGAYLLAKYYSNCRGGGLFRTGTTDWVDDANRDGGSNVDKGINHWHNNDGFDPIMYWYWNYDAYAQGFWGPSYPGSRLWVPFVGQATVTNADTTVAILKRIISMACDSKGLLVTTWHDQNNNPPALEPNLGGLPGVMKALRYAAHYCRNGLLEREGLLHVTLEPHEQETPHRRLLQRERLPGVTDARVVRFVTGQPSPDCL